VKATIDSMIRISECSEPQQKALLAPIAKIYEEFVEELPAGLIGGINESLGVQTVVLPRGLTRMVPSTCEIVDARNYGTPHAYQVDRSKLDPEKLKYQDMAVAQAAPFGEGILASPTGSGKTVMQVLLLEKLGVNALILTHTTQIAGQIAAAIKSLTGQDAGFIGGGQRVVSPVTVGLIQSVRSYDPILTQIGALIIDEAHHISAASYLAALKACTARFRFGFTATINKSDSSEKIIYAAIGPKLVDISMGMLQDNGLLNKGVVRVVYSDAIATRFDYVSKRCWYYKAGEKSGEKKCPHPCTYPKSDEIDKCVYEKGYYGWVHKKLSEDQLRNEKVVKAIREVRAENPWTVVLTHRKDHAKLLYEAAKDLGDVYLAIGPPMKEAARKASIAAYVSSGGTLVCTTGILGEGFDAPKTSCLVRAMPSGGKVSVRQQTGRVLRPQEKPSLIVDFVDPKIPWLKKLWMGRLSIYKAIGCTLESKKPPDADLFG
jgi:superfamily II DNA or RNA helicase